MIIITDQGFAKESWRDGFTSDLAMAKTQKMGLDIAIDQDVTELVTDIAEISMLRLAMPHFADGRALSQAASLRAGGYRGRIRLMGHVLSDQYAMVRRSGIDEVEISRELAKRQPEQEWLMRANWRAFDHRARFSQCPSDSGVQIPA